MCDIRENTKPKATGVHDTSGFSWPSERDAFQSVEVMLNFLLPMGSIQLILIYVVTDFTSETNDHLTTKTKYGQTTVERLSSWYRLWNDVYI